MNLVAHPMLFAVGIIGNIISVLVFLSPIPTFLAIRRRRSSEGFQSIPYVVALFSAMLLLYYASLKTDDQILLITINGFGCFIESIYIGLYLFYSPRKITTVILLVGMLGSYTMMVILTHFLVPGVLQRQHIVGWICLSSSICLFAAPLLILKQVFQSRNVEFMPLLLTITLTINAVVWFFYGYFIKDINILFPNVIGFAFGVVQMGFYWWFRRGANNEAEGVEDNEAEGVEDV